MIDTKTIAARVAQLRKRLGKIGAGAMVVSKAANVWYLTGFSGDDSWAFVSGNKIFLITDSRYTEQAGKECVKGCEIIDRTGAMSAAVAGVAAKCKVGKAIAIEDQMSIASQKAVKKAIGGKILVSSGVVEELRQVKDGAEVELIRIAGKIAVASLREAIGQVRVGMSEGELAGLINLGIRKRGWRESFETIVAFGANASRPHHLPGVARLKRNDTILVDWGVRYQNYCCDLTRCFAVGKVDAEYKRIYDAVLEAQRAAIAKVRAGVSAAEVDEAARGVIRKYDLPVYGHGTGHGVGLEVHEGPVVSGRNKGKLRAGEVITIEPGVYMPGKAGVRIEDDILVTAGGCEVISKRAGALPQTTLILR